MDFISQNKEIFLLLSFILGAVAFGISIFNFFKIISWQKGFKSILVSKTDRDLEHILDEIFEETKNNKNEIQEIKKVISHLTDLAEKGIQKIGIIRFNPFKDTGGDLSFSLALLDYYNNGVVISSLHGREETRIYAKPIINGKSQYNLSVEEEKALKKAMSNNIQKNN